MSVTDDGRYAYVSNTGSGTVSSFVIGRDGSMTLLDATAGAPGGESIDSALDRNSRHLYQLDAAGDKVRRLDG
ncbi:MAG: hypothetical protein ABWZ26_03655 [Candidatus Nanopelagicales bacterium]